MEVAFTYMTMNDCKEMTPFFLKMLKCATLTAQRNIKDANVTLYCDSKSYNVFKQLSWIPRAEVIDFDKYKFDHRFWCFPKFVTYSLQDKPFVHIDIDMAITKDLELGDQDIFCERLRELEGYPEELEHADKKLPVPKKICCSGIYGGNNVSMFKDLFYRAREVCSEQRLKGKEVLYEHLYSLEEVYMTQQILDKKLSILEVGEDVYQHFWMRPKEQFESSIDSILMKF